MKAHRLRTLFRGRNFFPAALTLLFLIVAASGFASGGARARQEGTAAEEREFVDTVPAHVPIKVRLKSEKSFKDLKNKGWARELEIEVKNTGSKPIYYLYVLVVMPDVLVQGHRLTMRTAYGRRDLGLPETPVGPEDQPVLAAGETLTVKLPEAKVRAYESIRDRDGLPDPKRVEFEIQAVKFGDGTGFRGRGGTPWREATKKQSSNAPSRGGDPKGRKPDPRCAKADSAGRFLKAFYPAPPASLLRATFFLSDEATPSPPSAVLDDCGCQNGAGCMWGRVGWSSCPCDDQFPAVVFAGGCASDGSCMRYVTSSEPCPTRFNGTQTCTYDDIVPGSCAIGSPTPDPSPSQSPSPPPTPIPTPTLKRCGPPKPGACCGEGAELANGCYPTLRVS